ARFGGGHALATSCDTQEPGWLCQQGCGAGTGTEELPSSSRVLAEDEEDEEEKIFPADSPVLLRELHNDSHYSVWVQASNALGTARSAPRRLSLQEIVVPALPVPIGANTTDTSPATTSTRWRSRSRLRNLRCEERHRATGTPSWQVEPCDKVAPEGPRWWHRLQSDTEFVFQARCRLGSAHSPWSAWSPPFLYRTPEAGGLSAGVYPPVCPGVPPVCPGVTPGVSWCPLGVPSGVSRCNPRCVPVSPRCVPVSPPVSHGVPSGCPPVCPSVPPVCPGVPSRFPPVCPGATPGVSRCHPRCVPVPPPVSDGVPAPPAAPAAAPAVWRRLGPVLPNGSREVTVLIKPLAARDARGRILSYAVSTESAAGARPLCHTAGTECSGLVPPGARGLLVTAHNSRGASSPARIPLSWDEPQEGGWHHRKVGGTSGRWVAPQGPRRARIAGEQPWHSSARSTESCRQVPWRCSPAGCGIVEFWGGLGCERP
uniref:Fibronectin type-III domain-containing protein n=1 Tax=Taeniopygia guttata TaxID=59729 RepID=A0A674HI82_TAEGU